MIAATVIGVANLLRWQIRVHGLDNVPRDGGAVLAFNHHSYLDFVMVAWGPVRRLRRPIRFLAKREIWASRWLGWLVRWAEAVPVDRGSTTARAGAFDAAADALRSGDLVAVAPEQTISPSFELLPFRTGAVRMAQLSGAPIVPAIGWGSQRIATKGGRIRPGVGTPIEVHFGAPVHVGADEDPVAATQRLQTAMTALLERVQRDYPDGTPAGAPWVPARLGGGAPDHAEVLARHQQRTRGWREPDAG
jgi:1-acyl-sn-glycerol-3-phosphate acyltransferase